MKNNTNRKAPKVAQPAQASLKNRYETVLDKLIKAQMKVTRSTYQDAFYQLRKEHPSFFATWLELRK